MPTSCLTLIRLLRKKVYLNSAKKMRNEHVFCISDFDFIEYSLNFLNECFSISFEMTS